MGDSHLRRVPGRRASLSCLCIVCWQHRSCLTTAIGTQAGAVGTYTHQHSQAASCGVTYQEALLMAGSCCFCMGHQHA